MYHLRLFGLYANLLTFFLMSLSTRFTFTRLIFPIHRIISLQVTSNHGQKVCYEFPKMNSIKFVSAMANMGSCLTSLTLTGVYGGSCALGGRA